MWAKPIASILRDRGYVTAGFVGNGVLGQAHGYGQGFDYYDEPTEEECWSKDNYLDPDEDGWFYEGGLWIDRLLEWLKSNYQSKFFVWGHYYETHEGSERFLLDKGLLRKGELAEFAYYDAKIKLVDEALFKPLLSLLKELGVYEDTVIVFVSDHGTNLGEHPANPIPYRPSNRIYPQHETLYDCDLKTGLVIKGRGVPSNHRVKGMVRSIDIAPTLLDLLGVITVHQFDGISLLPAIESGRSSGLVAYAEELYHRRGPGDFQALRTDGYKYIIDRRNDDTEQFYDLESDPGEQMNIADILNEDQELLRKEMREVADFWFGKKTEKKEWSEEERSKIEARLRMLGYVK